MYNRVVTQYEMSLSTSALSLYVQTPTGHTAVYKSNIDKSVI